MMIEAILKKELINNSRIEDSNKTKVRSGMSKGRAEWKVQTKNFFDLLFVILWYHRSVYNVSITLFQCAICEFQIFKHLS